MLVCSGWMFVKKIFVVYSGLLFATSFGTPGLQIQTEMIPSSGRLHVAVPVGLLHPTPCPRSLNYKKSAAMWACNVKSPFPESRANRVSHLIWGKMAKPVRSVRMCASARVSFHRALSFSLNYLEKGWGVHPARRRKNRNQDRLKRTSVLFTKSVVELLGSFVWNHMT